jgi:hypothetical protein
MKNVLRRPLDRLAGCVWLARFADKTRLYLDGRLEVGYAGLFCHPRGVDGFFLEHFGLSKTDWLSMVHAVDGDDAKVARWFLNRETVTPGAIAYWNEAAPALGRDGHAGEATLRWCRAYHYRECQDPRVDTLFLAIAWDEGFLEEPAAYPRIRLKPRLLADA